MDYKKSETRTNQNTFSLPKPICNLPTKITQPTKIYEGSHGVMFILIENGHDDERSNPRQSWLHFTYRFGKIWIQLFSLRLWLNSRGGCPRGVRVKAMDYWIVVSEFVLQSPYYVHFRANTLGKGMNPLYPPSYGLNSTITVLLGEWLWH